MTFTDEQISELMQWAREQADALGDVTQPRPLHFPLRVMLDIEEERDYSEPMPDICVVVRVYVTDSGGEHSYIQCAHKTIL